MEETGKGQGSAKSTLKLTLQRGDLNAKFECRVESDALEQPITNWVVVDIHVPPTRVTLTGVKSHVVAGSNVMLECIVHGARPAAYVKWINGSREITNPDLVESLPYDNPNIRTDIATERDGTYTTKSTLTFKASHYENGMKVHCYAGNEVTKKKALPEMHSLMIMEVRYPPVITVRPTNITVTEATEKQPNNEGILLGCSYKANPQELKGAWWEKDGKNLTESIKYKGGNLENPPLFIVNATREDMGKYVCWLSNEIGTAKSEEEIHLDVMYPPDAEIIMDPSSPVKESDNATVWLTCNVTDGNPINLTGVRWYLDGTLLKEFPECDYSTDAKGGEFCDESTTNMSLSLKQVGRDFAGNYTCQGGNEAGWGPESEVQEVIVYYPPSPARLMSQPSDRVVKGGSLKLTCSVDDVGNPRNVTYKWFRGSHQLTETTNEYNITHVGLETRSSFTCIAVNEGGESQPANRSINVTAPPQIFNKLQPYKGVLYNSEYVNVTCRFECSPKCSVVWKKDGRVMNFKDNYLYYTNVTEHPPDRQKNMFESVESTLVWNLTSWGNKINKTTPNSNYTCQSQTFENGLGPSSTIEIAIDYPPEDVKVTPSPVNVHEGMYHPPIRCAGRGQPQSLEYKWKKTATSEAFATGDTLNLGQMYRNKSGSYICEASNKHGSEQATLYINVQYPPECTLTRGKNKEGESSLVCTVLANPQQVDFYWNAKEGNETFAITSKDRIQRNGLLESYLTLDPSIDTRRTYYCRANNTVGFGNKTCEMTVDGILPWWKSLNHENVIIIVASIVAIIICVIIICIVIIVLCRRKRASTKYNSPLEMEEREKPDGHSPLPHDQSKWPLKPGVIVHLGKMNNISISQLNHRASPFKTTSVKTRAYLKLRRNKSKVYARLKRIKEAFGIGRCRTPLGIKEGTSGVVTFKKIKTSPIPAERMPGTINLRKRKKPGEPPIINQSFGVDKIRPPGWSGEGGQPIGNMQDHPSMTKIPDHSQDHPLMNANDPNDKGFYENLPYHGLQNPPNKPISIIAPFNQELNQSLSTSQKSLQNPLNQTFPGLSFSNFNRPVPNLRATFNPIRRNQSFHGFQSNSGLSFNNQLLNWQIQANFAMSNSYLNSSRMNLYPNYNSHNIIYPPQLNGQNRLSTLSFLHLTKSQTSNLNKNPFTISNSLKQLEFNSRIQGRNEASFDLKRTTPSGLLLPKTNSEVKPIPPIKDRPRKAILSDKRFGSLKTEKHKCYSPTFYSMRCKKHAKKRPIVYALPKKCLGQLPKSTKGNNSLCSSKTPETEFQNLTDSIQILEESNDGTKNDIPVPAPRCKKHKKPDIIYANICNSLQRSRSFTNSPNSSNDSVENSEVNKTSTIEAVVHVSESPKSDFNNFKLAKYNSTPRMGISNLSDHRLDFTPKISSTCPKKVQPLSPMPKISPQAMKNSPVLKVSPNFVKPKVESPKGALQMQIQAKRKASPAQSPLSDRNVALLKATTNSEQAQTDQQAGEQENSNTNPNVIENDVEVKQMPILIPQKPIRNNKGVVNVLQNAFYTLTTPHCKPQIPPPQYSTIPHPKHTRLTPKALFQEQISKSKSLSSKNSKNKKPFQIPLQKCQSFKFQTAESYFQPIKNIHEQDLMRNGYTSDYQGSSTHLDIGNNHTRHKRTKPKQKTKGPLVLMHPNEVDIPNSIQLQYPQPVLGSLPTQHPMMGGRSLKQNGAIQYADLDMAGSRKSSNDSGSTSGSKSKKQKPKTEYATLKFNEIGQEIDV